MSRRWLVLLALVVPLALAVAGVRVSRRASPQSPASLPPASQPPASQPPASQPPATSHAGHGAHGAHGAGAGIDWGSVSERDLDVAAVFLTARDEGVGRALDRLRALVARDATLAPMGHVIAHALGRYAVAHADDDPSVYAQCREDFQAGCWHGVMEGYFTSARAAAPAAVTPAALGALCASIVRPGPARLPRLECAHGMGHGLTARARNDYRAALRACDALTDADARGECHDGVFMEVTVRGTEPRPGTNDATLLRRADLRWPCSGVDPVYRPSCWAYQPIVVYEFTDDLARTAATCPRPPDASAESCHRGFGKQLTGWLPNDSAVLAACRLGDARLLGACVSGAAEGRVDETWTAARALALCRSAPAEAKGVCYGTVGARMVLIHPRDDELARDCAGAEPAFVAACRAGGRTD